MEDHNTRIIVFGSNARDARAVADAIASEAFHNVSFIAEPIEQVQRAAAITGEAANTPQRDIAAHSQ